MKSRFLSCMSALALWVAATSAGAALVAVDTKILNLMPRDWGLHVRIETSVSGTLAGLGIACLEPSIPVYLPARADYKSAKDALYLAYAMKKTVKIYFDNAPSPENAPICLSGHYPKILSIDVLEN